FHALLNAFLSISRQSYVSYDVAWMEQIPQNGRALYDLFVKNISIEKEGRRFQTNLGINRSQIKGPEFRSMSYSGRIDEQGDIEMMYGYDEIDADGMHYTQGKVHRMTKQEWEAMSAADE